MRTPTKQKSISYQKNHHSSQNKPSSYKKKHPKPYQKKTQSIPKKNTPNRTRGFFGKNWYQLRGLLGKNGAGGWIKKGGANSVFFLVKKNRFFAHTTQCKQCNTMHTEKHSLAGAQASSNLQKGCIRCFTVRDREHIAIHAIKYEAVTRVGPIYYLKSQITVVLPSLLNQLQTFGVTNVEAGKAAMGSQN